MENKRLDNSGRVIGRLGGEGCKSAASNRRIAGQSKDDGEGGAVGGGRSGRGFGSVAETFGLLGDRVWLAASLASWGGAQGILDRFHGDGFRGMRECEAIGPVLDWARGRV